MKFVGMDRDDLASVGKPAFNLAAQTPGLELWGRVVHAVFWRSDGVEWSGLRFWLP